MGGSFFMASDSWHLQASSVTDFLSRKSEFVSGHGSLSRNVRNDTFEVGGIGDMDF